MSDIAWPGKYLVIGMLGVTYIPAHAFISTVLESQTHRTLHAYTTTGRC